MKKYHVNDKGEPAVCEAQSSTSCRYGGEDHTEVQSIGEAREFAEQRNAEKVAASDDRWTQSDLQKVYEYAQSSGDPEQVLKEVTSLGKAKFFEKYGLSDSQDAGSQDTDDRLFGGKMPTRTAHIYEGRAETVQDLYGQSDAVVDEDEALGVRRTKNTGVFSQLGYFQDSTLRGRIDRQRLIDDPHAYKSLGFRELEDGGEYELQRIQRYQDSSSDAVEDHYGSKDYAELSSYETSGLTAQESSAVYMYTTYEHQNINRGLYSGEVSDGQREDIRLLDSALSSASPQKQRILYRGVPPSAEMLKGYDNTEDWVDEKFPYGAEAQFAGYQSTSQDPSHAPYYIKDGGAVFEILTPEGVNVSSHSDQSYECEVLLPRNARYVVADVKRGVTVETAPGLRSRDNTVVRLVAVGEDGEVLDGSSSGA